MYEVIFFSQSGSTRKLASAIADELGAKARHVKSVGSLCKGTDVFLGSGLYFMRPAKMVRDFIRDNDFSGRNVALFGTSGTGIGIELLWMERLLKRKGAVVAGKYYCAGQFAFRAGGKSFTIMHKGHPANKELEKARQFARSIENKIARANPVIEKEGQETMKIEYFHASHFGNGAVVAEEFKKQMAFKGVTVNVHHIRDTKPGAMPAADLYFFSAPGRFGKPIGSMRSFLKSINLPAGTPYAVLTTEPAPKPDKKTGRIEPDKWQRVLPIMNELLEGKGLEKVADCQVYVTGLKGPLEADWQKKVEAIVSRIPVPLYAPAVNSPAPGPLLQPDP